mgnify:CR=1 FL=1
MPKRGSHAAELRTGRPETAGDRYPYGELQSTTLSDFDKKAHSIVKDLHVPKPGVFWTDLCVTAVIAWTLFALATVPPYSSWLTLICTLGASFAFYRALCFIHEISHLRRVALPGFETIWNVLVGVPMLMPSFVYSGVHNDHHSLATYGTKGDPEYLPFSTSRGMIIVFTLQSLLIPIILIVRFIPVSIVCLIVPRFQRWVAAHASSLTMNVFYRRNVTADALSTMVRWQIYILLFLGFCFAAVVQGLFPWQIFPIWYAATAFASLVNALRTLGAHSYETSGAPRGRLQQLEDSIDTPGAFFTELWAPVGLRYHALHHYFPGIPYHNLGEAYRRLTGDASPYARMSSAGLAASLSTLYRIAKNGTS